MSIQEINVINSNVHNLKNVSVKIPKNKFTVITGPSGSGKSSLAFDTIYVEGQRRYIESLSSYARQFLGQHQAPDVESITGLSPAISIDQKSTTSNPRSTVGTITEIFDYMRVLFARVGDLYDPNTGLLIKKYTPAQISKIISSYKPGSKIHIMAPVSCEKNNIKKLLDSYLKLGFARVRINGTILNLDSDLKLGKDTPDFFEIVIDRLVIKDGINKRLNDSIEHSLKIGNGVVSFLVDDEFLSFSDRNMNPNTGEFFPDLEPRLFSFNSPVGACSKCNGLGESKEFTKNSLIFDSSLPVLEGAITAITKKNNFLYKMIECVFLEENVPLSTPLSKLSKKMDDLLFNGSEKIYSYVFKSENSHFEFSKPFPGILSWLDKKFLETTSDKVRNDLEKFMRIQTCGACKGYRLNPVALNTKINDVHIMTLCKKSISDLYNFFKEDFLSGEKLLIGEKLIKEIRNRLQFLVDVGLTYLTLDRSAVTLSGGESQRIRLATQIGSALSGVLYVLDEPSIGLHQRDNEKLIKTLKELRDLGNTLLVVEHDEDTMKASDFLIDIGPGSGHFGGEIIDADETKKVIKCGTGITAKFLRGELTLKVPSSRRSANKFLKLKKAKKNNLKDINLELPLNLLTCITGVSGSGKSTLVHQVLVPAVKNSIRRNADEEIYYHSISGLDNIKSIIELDQSPIGRTPHSNPATYSGLFDEVRTLFSKIPESKIRGYKPGRFSFNVKGGRCEECEGNGTKKIEMHFLPDVYIQCSECNGSRFNNETLSILYKGMNISDVLNMEISEAVDFFSHHPKMNRILSTLNSLGLGYMKLGQPATTLSGGEAQRLKLAKELAKKTRGHCLYILDEPTTGLHFNDIKVLLVALNNLVDQGNTVVVIEHNLDVIKSSDYIIDLGPEGGDNGGTIVAEGTPEAVSKSKNSETARFLKKIL